MLDDQPGVLVAHDLLGAIHRCERVGAVIEDQVDVAYLIAPLQESTLVIRAIGTSKRMKVRRFVDHVERVLKNL